jgi:FSR family fosmidomycin resistance protein-like MFS transporter
MMQTSLRQDARVIGLVGVSHGVSHFYHLILAGLFPWLKSAFALSYAELGLLMTVFFVVSGVGQACRASWSTGSARAACCFPAMRCWARRLAAGRRAQLWDAAAGSLLAGCGNAVFHPAGYTLLNQNVSKERLPHAFSVHGISGNIGWAAAPLFLAGCRHAVELARGAAGAAAIPALHAAAPVPQPQACWDEGAASRKAARRRAGRLLRLPAPAAVWMCFGFFFLTSVALGGIQAFSSTSLTALYGISLATAATAYTTFMLSSAAGHGGRRFPGRPRSTTMTARSHRLPVRGRDGLLVSASSCRDRWWCW